eukprot:TRINITY_DN493_c0_g2_i5.p1 TRINITY_DN493_c0_g2~~TRINITY_DN493_c0_g2_i5.p1  ORF type:complete len:316 (-),score=46.55 TRINITY_DN493_c0_g2_i5:265-1212(-)
MPGLVGLNNMAQNDYINVVIQMMSRCVPVREFFLAGKEKKLASQYFKNKTYAELVVTFGELMRKMWNVRNFKGLVSPHEFLQAVVRASNKKFTIGAQKEPQDFYVWLCNVLHQVLKKKQKSVISDCFQGDLEITTETPGKKIQNKTQQLNFWLLSFDLPSAPLFKDVMENKVTIPQIPIFNVLAKFDGETLFDDIKLGRRKFRLLRLPPFLVLHLKRFTKNNFFVEKNPTIMNFPVKNLELRDFLKSTTPGESTKYDLTCNIVHEGKAQGGQYKIHVHRRAEDQWYQVQDLSVQDLLPQIVALSEAYMQVYERKN